MEGYFQFKYNLIDQTEVSLHSLALCIGMCVCMCKDKEVRKAKHE